MLPRKFGNYILHMAGITQNKQKCFIFIAVPQGRKKCNQIRSKWRKKLTLKNN